MRRWLFTPLLSFVLITVGCSPANPSTRTNDRIAYQQRLHGMWLGATIANWTGLITERVRQEPPFYTDEDWGTRQQVDWIEWKEDEIIDFVFQDPWLADDDTDIEYVYLHLMTQHQTPYLNRQQIADGWQAHINRNIWVSNASARALMDQNAYPPVTSMLAINPNGLMIDAQLTTEFFGALAPGMPAQALELANLPIQTTATGYAAHASQFYVVLYSLGSQVDQTLPPDEQVVWLVEEARKLIPNSSKTADIVDFVLADFEANPDINDWERTRDRIYDRYHLNAEQNGFVYQDWVESSVNFATAVMALLYGGGDYKRTVQIGTLSGWDSDNGTSTMGGLLGLMLGIGELVAQFPDQTISDRYHSWRTRDNLPDYLPNDAAAEDSFALMAERMIPLVEAVIVEAGGEVDDGNWQLPPLDPIHLSQNPLYQLYEQSNNNRVRLNGGEITAVFNGSEENTAVLVNGAEFNFSGYEPLSQPEVFQVNSSNESVTIDVTYSQPVVISTIWMVEGQGGGFAQVAIELQIEGQWEAAELNDQRTSHPNETQAYELLEFVLAQSQQATGFRIKGQISENNEGFELLEIDSFQ